MTDTANTPDRRAKGLGRETAAGGVVGFFILLAPLMVSWLDAKFPVLGNALTTTLVASFGTFIGGLSVRLTPKKLADVFPTTIYTIRVWCARCRFMFNKPITEKELDDAKDS